MRVAIEQEAYYAAEYPFVDYGADLALMSELEKGVRLERIPRSEADAKPNPQEEKDVEEYLSKLRPRKYDNVPL